MTLISKQINLVMLFKSIFFNYTSHDFFGLISLNKPITQKVALEMIYINQCLRDASHKLLNKCELKLGLPVDLDFHDARAPGKLRPAPTSPMREDRPCSQVGKWPWLTSPAVDTCPKRQMNGLQDPETPLQRLKQKNSEHRSDHHHTA